MINVKNTPTTDPGQWVAAIRGVTKKLALLSAAATVFYGGALAAATSNGQAAGPSSQLITNVIIIDGSGAERRRGAVRIEGGKIIAISNNPAGPDISVRRGESQIDGGGLVLAPGFIDPHSHHERGILEKRSAVAATSQGITTIIVGQDGSSRVPLEAFYNKLNSTPVAVNVGSYSGHNTLREIAMRGTDMQRPATAAEIARMSELLTQDIRAGALGLSTGLGYESGIHSKPEEVQQLAIVAAKLGGGYISHIRNENVRVNESVDEAIEIGRRAGGRTQISHIKIAAKRYWGQADDMLRRLDAARAAGINMTADIYPYTYWQSTMSILLEGSRLDDRKKIENGFREAVPPELIHISRFEADKSVVGKSVAEVSRERGKDPVDVYLGLIKQAADYEAANPNASGPVESIIGTSMAEKDIETFLRWQHSTICSDGADGGHPRGYGTFTRVLGKYVRERNVLTLEQAIHKMTGLTAQQLGIAGRGMIQAGSAADLVLFDPRTVDDRATIENPTARSVGIEKVWVNGEIVFQSGKPAPHFPGRIVRAQPTTAL